jgi:hypothetical protein
MAGKEDAAAVASIAALSVKASELYGARMFSRAADKYAAAASAAAALQPADNAVVALSQARQVIALLADGYDFFNTGAALHAARTHVAPLLRAALAVAQRRKDAGTLRPGACSAFEEAFESAFTRAGIKQEAGAGGASASAADVQRSAAGYAPHVGYRAHMTVASAAVSFLALAVQNEDAAFSATHEAFIFELYTFIAAALDCMRTVALPAGMVFPAERDVVRLLEARIMEDESIRVDTPTGAALLRAWRALQRSGVLAARGIAARARADERSLGGCRVVRITPDMRRCALASCGEPEMHAKGQFKLCAACKTVAYCCKAHQAEDWAAHKAACKAARGSAKGAGAANDEKKGGAGLSTTSAGGAK